MSQWVNHAVRGTWLSLLCVFVLAVAAGTWGGADRAVSATVPLGHEMTTEPVVDQSLVQKVHGCHARAKVGPATGVLHRHVGAFCTRKVVKRNVCAGWRQRCGLQCINARKPARCTRRCLRKNAPPRCL